MRTWADITIVITSLTIPLITCLMKESGYSAGCSHQLSPCTHGRDPVHLLTLLARAGEEARRRTTNTPTEWFMAGRGELLRAEHGSDY